MKNLILNLKKDRQAFLFVILGLILIAVPAQISSAVPFLLGIPMVIYAILNVVISFRYREALPKLGNSILAGVLGLVILLQKADSLSTIGVIWAIFSLHESAEEINEFIETKHFNIVSCISIIISVVLAAMLMFDPFEHFETHIRILGLEIIASVFTRRKRLIEEKVQRSAV